MEDNGKFEDLATSPYASETFDMSNILILVFSDMVVWSVKLRIREVVL